MYKLLLSLLVILCLSISANAQFSKGNLLLGGTLSYGGNTSTNTGTEQSNHSGNFNITPGKAISDNSVFGINLGYGFNNVNYSAGSGQGSSKSNTYSVGVFYRKYKTLGKDFFLFGSAGAGYNGSTWSSADNFGNQTESGNSNGGYLNFYPGIDFRVSKRFLLEFSIPSLFYASYTSTQSTSQNLNPPTTKGSQFGISTSITSNPLYALGVGFVLVL